MPFERGNDYAKRGNGNGRPAGAPSFRDALHRAMLRDKYARLHKSVESLLDAAAAGEQWALKELADRWDGKAAQTINANVKAEMNVTINGNDAAVL